MPVISGTRRRRDSDAKTRQVAFCYLPLKKKKMLSVFHFYFAISEYSFVTTGVKTWTPPGAKLQRRVSLSHLILNECSVLCAAGDDHFCYY